MACFLGRISICTLAPFDLEQPNVHPNVASLTHLFKGSNMPTKIGRTFTGSQEQFWPDALPDTTIDSYGYQWDLNQGLLGASPLP